MHDLLLVRLAPGVQASRRSFSELERDGLPLNIGGAHGARITTGVHHRREQCRRLLIGRQRDRMRPVVNSGLPSRDVRTPSQHALSRRNCYICDAVPTSNGRFLVAPGVVFARVRSYLERRRINALQGQGVILSHEVRRRHHHHNIARQLFREPHGDRLRSHLSVPDNKLDAVVGLMHTGSHGQERDLLHRVPLVVGAISRLHQLGDEAIVVHTVDAHHNRVWSVHRGRPSEYHGRLGEALGERMRRCFGSGAQTKTHDGRLQIPDFRRIRVQWL
mmetsp:Transcript_32572/g.78248  ORF Transcript_32572/g.78248 Transcript_32572/m.78248 type:complete len:275 (+) Transcript_32572:3515-4339(+)